MKDQSINNEHANLDREGIDKPFQGPTTWYSYRCCSCGHADWIEDIIVDAFPPTEPGGCPELICPECGGQFLSDASVPEITAYTKPPPQF